MINNNIYALFTDKTIRIYQAYNNIIADEAIKKQTFGDSFKLERMTWIKPSFLWMMYRSGWATKKNQERILTIDILRIGFEAILKNAILTKYESNVYSTYDEWKEKLNNSEVRCQWDPERDIYGNPINRRSIQLGLKGKMVEKYINEWILKITDITQYVYECRKQMNNGVFNIELLPVENVYPINDEIKKVLGIDIYT